MPSRVIRGAINSSASLSRVSIGAELTFDRLITAVDDYGRYDARPVILKAGLFPVRAGATPKKIAGWVAELAHEGCIRLYEVDGRPYLAMTAWEKHRGKGRRGTESKFPEPPETHSPASSDPLEIRGDPPGGRGSGVGGREAGGGFDAASPPLKKSAGSAKQKTLCPEKPTPEQWDQIRAWRDRSHSGWSDDHLRAGWLEMHLWSMTNDKTAARWTFSLYRWLTNDIGKPKGVSTARPPPPAFVSKGDARPLTEAEREEVAAIKAQRTTRRLSH